MQCKMVLILANYHEAPCSRISLYLHCQMITGINNIAFDKYAIGEIKNLRKIKNLIEN